MLLALIFRGVAFEFRFRAETRRGRVLWDCGLRRRLGDWRRSARALALGGLLQGIRVAGPRLCGRMVGLADPLHASVRLRAGGRLRAARRLLADLAHRRAAADGAAGATRRRSASRMLALIGVVSLWTPLLNPVHAALVRLAGHPLTSPVPLLLLALAWRFWRGLSRRARPHPFLCALGWFVLCYAGLGDQPVPADRAALASPSGRPPGRRRACCSCWSARPC